VVEEHDEVPDGGKAAEPFFKVTTRM